MAKQTKRQAVERRTQRRLAVREEAAKGRVEKRAEMAAAKAKLEKHTARPVAETREKLNAEEAAKAPNQQPQATKQSDETAQHRRKTKRGERATAQDKGAGGAMATVAVRGEQAERLRALAAKHELTLAKLLVRMMEMFEAQVR